MSAGNLQSAGSPASVLPTVSVIVPCFNYGHFLEQCVASVISQSGVDARVLVIDDCSTDDSAAVGLWLARTYDAVAFRAHSSNAGLIATANEGLAWSQGDFVVLLSSDDMLVPGALSRAVSVMQAHPNVGMVYGRALLAEEDKRLPAPSGVWRRTDIWPGADWIRHRCRSAHNCISSPEVVVRREIARAVGLYDPACRHASDLNMWLRIAAVSDIAYVNGTPQAIYRVHSDGMYRSAQGPLIDLKERRLAFDCFFASSASRLEAPERQRAMVRRALAKQALWRASRAVDRGWSDGLVEELIEFAFDVCPSAYTLREWWGLRLRRRIGAGRSMIFFPFLATGAAHRLRHHVSLLRWRYKGI